MRQVPKVREVLRFFPGSSQEQLDGVPGHGGIVAVMDTYNQFPRGDQHPARGDQHPARGDRHPARGGPGSARWYVGATAALLAIGVLSGVALAGNTSAPAGQAPAASGSAPADSAAGS
jgi:hypothetical protein